MRGKALDGPRPAGRFCLALERSRSVSPQSQTVRILDSRHATMKRINAGAHGSRQNVSAATSEVGSDQTSQLLNPDILRSLLELQNQNVVRLIESIKLPCAPVVSLPQFNPELPDADPRAWCSKIDVCMTEKPLDGGALVIVLSKALKGSASTWLPQVSFAGMTWAQFKEIFLARYGCIETCAATVINLLNGRPKDDECLAAYASRLMTTLTSRWSKKTIEEVAVSVVLAHTAQFNRRLHHLAFTNDITTRSRLQQELKAFSSAKRKYNSTEPELSAENKRYKPAPSNPVQCHSCGKLGHKAAECRKRMVRGQVPVNTSSGRPEVKNSVTCYRCGEKGHVSTRCTRSGATNNGSGVTSFRATSGSSNAVHAERRVDVCEIRPVISQLTQSGESYSFCYDSGAECSLIKEGTASRFSGTRHNTVISIVGIGNSNGFSTCQIQSEVSVNGYTFEVLFHAVPDNCLKYDVMPGRDILKQGFSITMTANSFSLTKIKAVDCCKVSKPFDVDKIDTDVPPEHKAQLSNLLNEFSDTFIDGLPRTRVTTGELKIRLVDPTKTVQRRPYRLSPDERQLVRDKIKEMLEARIIRPSCSPFASPILLVKKRDGSDRMCVDYRELNHNTVPDRFPLPLIQDQIARLADTNYLTCLDCASGFNLIPVHPDSIELTAFVTPDGQYEYLKMPFGLRNAPSVFQRAVTRALGDLVYSYVIVYMDDILIPSRDVNEGLERLRTVLDLLTKAGFSLKFSKCSFLKSCVEFLGYKVSSGKVMPNPRKVEALTKLPPPETIYQLRQFIGLASYFRKFIPNFSQIMRPLFLLINNGKSKLSWTPEHEVIRKKIIFILTNEPVLIIFNPNYPIEIHTDASADGYGAIFFLKVDDKLHVVEYFSKRTTGPESRYHSYELETLAVVNAIKHFRHYLEGRQFTVITDCNSLKASRNKVDLTPRVHRWWAYLQAFDFDIMYRECAARNITKNAECDKTRFDSTKSKLVKFKTGDFVLIRNEERNQTKLDPKFRGPFKIIEVLDGDRYLLKSLTGNRTYKYAHDRVRKMPECQVSNEFNESD
ncbi:uncharacterized protein LOC143210721 [Lasioglossum baleicum]|uniref:uncharacterized protein LOC143210721 n=1 Tax=Lasioglossum baleicum TaxID=434251 RepID=UPI003FCC5B3C